MSTENYICLPSAASQAVSNLLFDRERRQPIGESFDGLVLKMSRFRERHSLRAGCNEPVLL
jgi:hypothetical protein